VTPDELAQEAQRIRATLFGVPAANQLAALKVALRAVPAPYRQAVEDLVLGIGVTVGRNMTKDRERRAAYAFGVVFGSVMLVVAVFIPDPTPFQYFVFRVLLALAAAGIAAFIPGFINVNWGKGVRAGGALAVFAVVYFFSPAQLLVNPKP